MNIRDVSAQIQLAFVHNPSSSDIAQQLTSNSARVCVHGLAVCYRRCGVRYTKSKNPGSGTDGYWLTLTAKERVSWLERAEKGDPVNIDQLEARVKTLEAMQARIREFCTNTTQGPYPDAQSALECGAYYAEDVLKLLDT